LKVVSWNMLNEHENYEFSWEDRKDGVCNYIKKISPTILGLQQVGLDNLEEIKACLPDHNLVETPVKSENTTNGYFNPIFYKKDNRYTYVSSGAFWLSKTPEVSGSKLEDANEAAFGQWVKMSFSYKASVKKPGVIDKIFNLLHIATEGKLSQDEEGIERQIADQTTTFYVVNARLDPYNKYVSEQQLEILMSHMKDNVMDRRRNHVVLTGNLNLGPKEVGEKIKRFSWLKNAVNKARFSSTALTLIDREKLVGKGLVDYVKHEKFQAVLSATLVDTNEELLSDHRPVIAALLP